MASLARMLGWLLFLTIMGLGVHQNPEAHEASPGSSFHIFETEVHSSKEQSIYWIYSDSPYTLKVYQNGQLLSHVPVVDEKPVFNYLISPKTSDDLTYTITMTNDAEYREHPHTHIIKKIDTSGHIVESVNHGLTLLRSDNASLFYSNNQTTKGSSITDDVNNLVLISPSTLHSCNNISAKQNLNEAINSKQTKANLLVSCALLPTLGADIAFNTGMFSEALPQYTQAHQFLNENLECASSEHCTYTIMKMGFSQVLIGAETSEQSLIRLGLTNLEKSLDLAQTSQMHDLLPEVYNGLATFYWISNDKELSIHYLKQAIYHTELINDSEEATVSYSNNLALIYMSMGELLNAQHLLQKSIYLSRELPDKVSLATQLHNYAKVATQLGNHEKAKRYFKEAINIFNTESSELGALNTGLSLIKLAFETKDYESVLEQYKKMHLGVKKNLQDQIPIMEAAYFLSQSYIKQHDTSNMVPHQEPSKGTSRNTDKVIFGLYLAEAYLNYGEFDTSSKWLDYSKQYLQPNQTENLKYNQLRMALLLKKSQPNIDDNQVTQHFNDAFTLLLTKTNGMDISLDGPSWMSQSKDLVSTYISYLLKQPDLDFHNLAFETLESYFSFMLRKSRQYYSELEYENENTHKLSKEKYRTEGLLVSVSSNEDKQQILNQIDKIEEQQSYELASKQITTDNTELFENLDINAIKTKLSSNEAILRYVELNAEYKAFVITKDNYKLITIEKDMIQADLSIASNGHSSYSKIMNAAHLPIQWLMAENIDKLYIASDGEVNQLSISAAKVKTSENRKEYLAALFEVIRVPSLSEYFSKTKNKASHNGQFTIFANPDFSYLGTDNNAGEFDSSWRNNLTPLPGSKYEVANISNLFPNERFDLSEGTGATNQELMSSTSRSSKIWHIATHGYYDPSAPEIVGLATTRSTDKLGRVTSGFLSLNELLSQPVSAHLVVLSGCDTSLGKYSESEGLSGLAKGMLAQGAGSVISTIWEVSDRSTAIFMKYFYQSLKLNKGDLSKSFTLAKRKMIKSGRFKHPKYWAGYNLTIANKQYEQVELY
ncbi:CHAT domain-containing tetratricopeptide repeat protein [uncultured Paraglaciecola sp.]|uniref:CHAT domain-containing protein n=1 Tax=uncultured Paraglaciecola sp. TaxID=1765024 RepID=UPI002597B6FA|nr:CHAT domain-containing tetratricopeptide repeat protein [uncultured Paraglaciecola sp.]